MRFKVKPEPGELHLLLFLEKTLDDSFEVFFNPYMNGDRPDVIIMRKNYGVLIIEVKDWNLDLYELDTKKHWRLKNENNAYPKSPIDQVLKYKDNLFELHINTLLEKKIKNIKTFNIVACAVYFHNANEKQITELLITPYQEDKKYQKFLKFNIDFIGRDNLNLFDFKNLLERRYLMAKYPSYLFTDDLYYSFKSFMYPTAHTKKEGVEFKYTKKQNEIIYATAPNKQQRISGVFGSGKTTILAARAVQAYKRLSEYKSEPRILILTYNITLKNFIHDKLSKVREDFSWSSFVINNYHEFINSELNNLGIQFEKEKISDLETNYYSNKQLFLSHKSEIMAYDAILIDEIQDYKRMWMEIIKECFLAKDGEYVLFGDVKQNIYANEIASKDVITNVKGQPNKLDICFRSDYKIKDLAVEYQKNFFKDKYIIDNLNEIQLQGELNLKIGDIKYVFLDNQNAIKQIYNIIDHQIKKNEINRNDITVLGCTINLLRNFEAYYRFMSNAKTTTMFETLEIMYLNQLNFLSRDLPKWLQEGLDLIDNNTQKTNQLRDKKMQHLAHLFALYDVYYKYPNDILPQISTYCTKYGTTLKDFKDYITKSKNNEEINKDLTFNNYLRTVYNANYDFIRKNKKIHFWMNTGSIKVSTIHSFKGWETEMLFLIIENKHDVMEAFDELLYTGLTRCRSKLIILNFGNPKYDQKIRQLMEKIN